VGSEFAQSASSAESRFACITKNRDSRRLLTNHPSIEHSQLDAADLAQFSDDRTKRAYLQGVLDAAAMTAAERTAAG
jgi:hypothetical protein